jgi:hypothetical protein
MMPSSETFFQLWDGTTPETVDHRDLEALWRQELDRWGGATAFKTHWDACRALKHDYVACDLLNNQRPLLERMERRPDSVIWWSNAFFTVYSNWLHTAAERRRFYVAWVAALAERDPDIYLYGADSDNSSVNALQARAYAERLARAGSDELVPRRDHRIQIRN